MQIFKSNKNKENVYDGEYPQIKIRIQILSDKLVDITDKVISYYSEKYDDVFSDPVYEEREDYIRDKMSSFSEKEMEDFFESNYECTTDIVYDFSICDDLLDDDDIQVFANLA